MACPIMAVKILARRLPGLHDDISLADDQFSEMDYLFDEGEITLLDLSS